MSWRSACFYYIVDISVVLRFSVDVVVTDVYDLVTVDGSIFSVVLLLLFLQLVVLLLL